MFFMRDRSVAVLDVRSSDVTAVVGERGVNGTFIIKSKYSAKYDGYAEGDMLDGESFLTAVKDVVKSTLAAHGKIKTFYVGVPGEFTKIYNSDKVISFNSSKRITRKDCEQLADLGKPQSDDGYMTIRYSCLYYVLSDKRKIIDPIGEVSDSLQGKFCYYRCKTAFAEYLMNALKTFDAISDVMLIPTVYAEAMYLIEPELRDDYAILFDLGYISSSYSVVCGNGLAFCESFSLGIGHIAMYLSGELDIPFDVASAFLSAVNLNAKEKLSTMEEYEYEGETYRYSTGLLRDKIREGLDTLCGLIEQCRQSYVGRNIDTKPLLITGEGIRTIRGAAEHISDRLVRGVEVVSPKVPYYDKPVFASLFSLLDAALKDAHKK